MTASATTGVFSSVINTTPGSAYAFSANYSAPKAVSVVVTAVPFVDLVVTQEQVPNELVAGLPATVTWTVTNQGNTPTTALWHDAVYLSADGQIDANAILLATQAEGRCRWERTAATGQYHLHRSRQPIPRNLLAASEHGLRPDAGRNQLFQQYWLGQRPSVGACADLLVTGLSVSPTSGLQSGGSLTVSWDNTNNGLGAVSNSFSDQVQIVNTTTRQTLVTAPVLYNETSRGPLSAGGFAGQQYSFQLPDGAAGTGPLQITVTNDIYNQVTEFNPTARPRRTARRASPSPPRWRPIRTCRSAGWP